jgi:RNA polymerase sigma factor (sigma-70 family)
MTGNASTAEDLVQDVFVRVLKYRATWRGEGRFETWLFRIARNARADYFRRARRMHRLTKRQSNHPVRRCLAIFWRAVATLPGSSAR